MAAREKQGESSDAIVRRVLDTLSGLRFGSVELIVHDGQIVQIERNEKLRLDSPAENTR